MLSPSIAISPPASETPEVAENVLASGDADMVSMARPLLADSRFVAKAAAGRADLVVDVLDHLALDELEGDRVAEAAGGAPAAFGAVAVELADGEEEFAL